MHRELAVSPPTNRSGFVLYGIPWLAALAAVAAALFLSSHTANTLAGWGLAASVLFCGLPHGAGDWWVMRLAAGSRWQGTTRAGLVAGYVLAALLTLGFWRWQPAWALVGFLALTVWHFGSADASVLLPAARPWRDGSWWWFGVGRGLLVICTPLVFRPVESAAILLPFAALAGEPGRVVAEILTVARPLVWTGAVMLTVGLRIETYGQPIWRRDRALTYNFVETAVLLALFRLAPPLLAFLCYWVAFHAWRHVLRIETLLHPGRMLSVGRALAHFHRRTVWLTLFSLPGLAVIFLLWPVVDRLTAYFVLLSALTVPHAVVIGWLDMQANRRLTVVLLSA